MTVKELKENIAIKITNILMESGPGYRKTATPELRSNNFQNVGYNPLATDHGNHGGSLDATSTPSTIDWNGARFKSEKTISLNNNRFTFYKIKNFGNPNITSTLNLCGNEKSFRRAIDCIYGAAYRNNKGVKFRTIVPEENPPKQNSLVRTFWEFSLDGGHTWNIVKPDPVIHRKESSLKENKNINNINNDNKTMKKIIRLTESELKKVIATSVKRLVKESYGQDSTPEQVMSQIEGYCQRGGMFGFEITDIVDESGEPYGYIQLGYDPQNNVLYGGGATNSGVVHDFEMEYDLSQSLDINLQNFYEIITEQLLNQGYTYSDNEF